MFNEEKNTVEEKEIYQRSINNDLTNKDEDILSTEDDININDSDIHSMPEKFLKPTRANQKGKNWIFIIGSIIGFIIIVTVTAFAFFVFRDKPETDNNILDLDIMEEEDIVEDTGLDLEIAQGRDKKRINDIVEIRTALSFSYSENQKYPNNLLGLGDYLNTIPVNPKPGGEAYYYQAQDKSHDYILIFSLEQGAELGNLILKDGRYQLRPNFGIESYIEEVIDEPEEEEEEEEPEEEDLPDISNGLLPLPPKGEDSDHDGLTNTEELLFGTGLEISDTDEDGFSDSSELLSLYDPLNLDQKLVNNINLVRVYSNNLYDYSILYPAKWLAEEISSDFKETIFYNNDNDDFFKIQIKDNSQGLTLSNWYLTFSSGASLGNLQEFETENKLTGFKTKDNLNFYVANGNKIFIISYILVNMEELNYMTTFDMFCKSFKLTSPEIEDESH